jgi:hypothetical protein
MANQPQNRLKRWLSDGPTVAYARGYRYACWAFNLLLYILLNLFYLRLHMGGWLPWQYTYETTSLTEQLLSPLNIFDFPAHIFVIGLLMTLLCVLPIITAQLYNFWYALPFPAVALLCGHQQILSLCLFVSCAAVSFQPFRFKSKFVAAVMCLIPELLYIVIFSGSNPETEVLRWAVLYAPWLLAFFFCLIFFGIILGIGHFVRYRPGVITPLFGLVLAGTVLLFHLKIGMNERDFRAYVYQYRPETVINLCSKDIQPLLEEEKAKILKSKEYLNPDILNEEDLLEEWKNAFNASGLNSETIRDNTETDVIAKMEARKFIQEKERAIQNIDRFIKMYPNDKRVAYALYYKGLLLDLKPNVRQLEELKRLRFYTDIPSPASQAVWQEILDRFGGFPVAIAARWRFAILTLQPEEEKPDYPERFRQATELLMEAQKSCRVQMEKRKEKERQTASQTSMSDIFNPKKPILSEEDLNALSRRIGILMALIAKENRPGDSIHEKRLAEFLSLDPYQLVYKTRLKALKFDAPKPDPLIDNIELAETMLIEDPERKGLELRKLIRNEKYSERDGWYQARIELAKLYLEKYNRSNNETDRETLLQKGRETLTPVLDLPPESIFVQQAQELLRKWPGVIEVKISNGKKPDSGS